MLYIDDIAALMQWRVLRNPDEVLRRRLPAGELSGCPENARLLRAEVAYLPPAFVPWHFMIPDVRSRVLYGKVAYTLCSDVPDGSFCKMRDGMCIAVPELVFIQLARRLSLPLLVKLGYELCGLYTNVKDERDKSLMRIVPLTSIRKLEKFIERAGSMRGTRPARRALQFLVEGSASARETDLSMTASLPNRLGGYSIPTPMMNYRVDFDEHATRIAKRHYAKCDLCWPDQKLDVEYDSEEHHGDYESSSSDKARANALRHMGYEVIFVTKRQFSDMHLCNLFMRDIAKITGHRIREKGFEIPAKRFALHAKLLDSSHHPVFETRYLGEERFWSV